MRFLTGSLVVAAALVACGTEPSPPPAPPPPPPPSIPISGAPVPELAKMDQAISKLMVDWKIPGGAVAVTYQGRLVYARGFGYADTATKKPVSPDALFRIASVSKPITATAIRTLIEAGKLSETAAAFGLLTDLSPPPGRTVDSLLGSITVAQLLWHTGGWDVNQSGEPFIQTQLIAQALGIPGPPTARELIRFKMGEPLDFRPGARYAYSNFGFAVAGRVIEQVSGKTYEAYVQSVLARAGITRMSIGHTRPTERRRDEVKYYDPLMVPSVFPGEGVVSFPDGGVYLESADAVGGWIASAVDLVRFLTAVDGRPTRPDLITEQSLAEMLKPPPGLWAGSFEHYAQGWLVRPSQNNWLHNGSTPGTAAFATKVGPDLTIAAVFNAREMVRGSLFELLIEPALLEGATARQWPAGDQFSQFP